MSGFGCNVAAISLALANLHSGIALKSQCLSACLYMGLPSTTLITEAVGVIEVS